MPRAPRAGESAGAPWAGGDRRRAGRRVGGPTQDRRRAGRRVGGPTQDRRRALGRTGESARAPWAGRPVAGWAGGRTPQPEARVPGGPVLFGLMADTSGQGIPEEVSFTNLDQPLFEGSGATKRDLVQYLDGVSHLILPELEGRPLSVIRVHRGQEAFMQKNLPKYTPSWVPSVRFWAESSKREVTYALCNDRRTLLWFANQRAVEYHPTLVRADQPDRMTHLVIDLDPPETGGFALAVRVAHLVRRVLEDVGLQGAVKTSGAKGLHVVVPIKAGPPGDAAAATRAIAGRAEVLDPSIATTAFMKEDRNGKVFVDSTRVGGATVVAAYSPRVRPGVPVSFPVDWEHLDDVAPADFTVHTALHHLDEVHQWGAHLPGPQTLNTALIEEGHAIPVARVQAMHEGKRRARGRPQSG